MATSSPTIEPNSFGRGLSLPDLADAELPQLRAVAEAIWLDAYLDLIGPGQIRYMMGLLYDPSRLRRERLQGGQRLRWILAGGQRAGYCGHDRPMPNRDTALHKLYLERAHHGSGLASAVVETIAAEARQAGSPALALRVNRGNARAIRFYRKAGFEIAGEDCLDIGGGYVMDDYLMRRELRG